ncbi:glycosyltransferase family 4 protein [Sphingomonas montanisoli]|uniref:Glycosyltransferase family 4 protein n=1 Tax=Sphingomonas montanisoli TaxID=2606412 RepID=A0A5D9C9K6_9SPHN|nr:glycosyltransferase family 1 protein [Sphingomonas montanisoli]TZG27957.1 glycosyltransferase family 4 protein [Sphingomonas montanisoli]
MSALEQTEIVLDLSRLMSRMLHVMPTGVDRVEMAYARALIEHHPGPLHFAAINPFGIYGRLDAGAVSKFLNETEHRWGRSGNPGWLRLRTSALKHLWQLRPRRTRPVASGMRRVFVQSSPAHLQKPEAFEAKLKRERAPLICLIHDLIPIEFPEYARPGGAEAHRLRMQTVAENAAVVLANSKATAQSFKHFLTGSTHAPRIEVAHLGTDQRLIDRTPNADWPQSPSKPYFVIVGTIEPRKNHLLLLHVWRKIVETMGPAAPSLIVIGRRGWENENIVDLLERCEPLRDHVYEYASLSDETMHMILRGARALLLPSFAEGFGMPVTEAMAIGIPVICSDLPALREASDNLAEFIDPIDGLSWMNMILDYAQSGSELREAQCKRIAEWSPPTWRAHTTTLLELVKEVS